MATIDEAIDLALRHLAATRPAEAEAVLRIVLAAEGTSAPAWATLGLALHQQSRDEEALAAYAASLRLDGDQPAMHYNRGVSLALLGRHAEAAEAYQAALALRPEMRAARANLGGALVELNRSAEAEELLRRAAAEEPRAADVWNNLGTALHRLGRGDEAMAAFARAVELAPDVAVYWYNYGNALREGHRLGEAEECYRRSIQLQPAWADVWLMLGNAVKEQGRIDEALAAYRECLARDPLHRAGGSNLLLSMQYRPDVTSEELLAAHRQWAARHTADILPPPDDRRPTPVDAERPLRIGFVSADLRNHPVGRIAIAAVEHFDPRACALFFYYSHHDRDVFTGRFQAVAAGWRDVGNLSDAALAETIRGDRLDVLFDLAGHTAGMRLPAFARRPAPLQIAWLGYECTTGLEALDYLVADDVQVPAGEERYFVERLLRLPGGYVAFEPPPFAPPVGQLPAARGEPFTFASFNNPAKINRAVVDAWAEILRRLPAARLLLKYQGYDDEAVAGRYRRLFAERGVEAARLWLVGRVPLEEHLLWYDRVDVALDPFPYSGTMTTCEALHQGVPVVAMRGTTFAGRDSANHLLRIGLGDWIADDRAGYIDRAVAAAAEPDALAALRAGLRQRLLRSTLADGPRLARELLTAVRSAWRQRNGLPPA